MPLPWLTRAEDIRPASRVASDKGQSAKFAPLTSALQSTHSPNDPGLRRLAQAGQSHVLPRESPM